MTRPFIIESTSGVNPSRFWAFYRRDEDGTEEVYGGTDYRISATGRGEGRARVRHGRSGARDWGRFFAALRMTVISESARRAQALTAYVLPPSCRFHCLAAYSGF